MVYGRASATVLRMANGELNGRQIQVIKPRARIYTRQRRPSFRSKDILNFSRFHNFLPPPISSRILIRILFESFQKQIEIISNFKVERKIIFLDLQNFNSSYPSLFFSIETDIQNSNYRSAPPPVTSLIKARHPRQNGS